MKFSLDVRRNWLKSSLISPNVNFFFDRANQVRNKRAKRWATAACVAGMSFFEILIFDLQDKNNLFYTKRGVLSEATVKQLFKVVVVFFLFLELEKNGRDDDFNKVIFDIFELPESEYANLIKYKMFDGQKNELDYSALPKSVADVFRNSRVSQTVMMHFYGLLMAAGFRQDFDFWKSHTFLYASIPVLAASCLDSAESATG